MNGSSLNWFCTDEGDAAGYPDRIGATLEHKGYIDTWSREYHVYQSSGFDIYVGCDECDMG